MNDRETKRLKRIIEGLMTVQVIAQDLERLSRRQQETMLEVQGLLRGDDRVKGES